MKSCLIYSDRHYQSWPSWQIIYEWEDIIAEHLNLKISNSPYSNNSAKKLLHKFLKKTIHNDFSSPFFSNNKSLLLYFEMQAKKYHSFSNQKNALPIIIDFWGEKDLKNLNKYYKNCPIIFVSSIEACNFIKSGNPNLNIVHFPLSLPDKYYLNSNQSFKKQFDIVLAGRVNPVLWEFLQTYEISHPEIEYLYQEQQNGELFYRSNKKGIVGNFQNRNAYYDLIRSAKISFYATPGIDGGEKRTGGFNPVTPRFLELLSAGCHVIARYPENAESLFYKMDSICPSVNNYEAFEKQMDFALNSQELLVKRNSEYLLDHYTSKRINTLQKSTNLI